jgi:hypothetical protein
MKLPQKILRTVRRGYLYGNGKLVLVHSEQHAKAGTVEYCSIHDASSIARHITGRIVLHNCGAVRLVMNAVRIRAALPTLAGGSPNTQRHGIPYGYVSLTFGPDEYNDTVSFHLFTDLVCGDFTYQPDSDWCEQTSAERWAGYPIANPGAPA